MVEKDIQTNMDSTLASDARWAEDMLSLVGPAITSNTQLTHRAVKNVETTCCRHLPITELATIAVKVQRLWQDKTATLPP